MPLRADHFLDEVRQRHLLHAARRSRSRARPAGRRMVRQRLTSWSSRARSSRTGGRDRRLSDMREQALHFLDDECDGRQRRAEFMGRGGRQAVELRQVLLAGEHQFGRGQSVGKLPRFLGDARRVNAGESGAEHDREPGAQAEHRRQIELLAREPGQRQVMHHQDAWRRAQSEARAAACGGRQRGGRDHHAARGTASRRGSFRPPVRNSSDRELHDVEAEQNRGRIVIEPVHVRIAQPQHDVDDGPTPR